MEVRVVAIGLIRLYPNNDADRALLEAWSEYQPRISSSSYTDGKVQWVQVEFGDEPEDTTITQTLKSL